MATFLFCCLVFYALNIAFGVISVITYFETIKPYCERNREMRRFKMAFQDVFPPMMMLSIIPFVGFGVGVHFTILVYLVKKTGNPHITVSEAIYEKLFGEKDEDNS